jgi:hypothetical protein
MVILGHCEVVHVEGVLRFDVAPDVAIPEMYARPLLALVRIRKRF